MCTRSRVGTLTCFWMVFLGVVGGGCSGAPGNGSEAGPDVSEQSGDEHARWVRANYEKADYMVPMRDGTRLFTIVYTPEDASQTFPILLYRTPYSIPPYAPEEYRDLLGPSPEFDRGGYIFAFQDVRGKYRSEGEFQVIRPLIVDPQGPADVDESTDNYDTIEWLLENIPNHNGRVGQWGISYSGWQTVMGMVDAHPALAAASPQASPADMFIGDDWHHNGAFRVMYSFSWLSGNARTRAGPTETRTEGFSYGTPSGYEFFMEAGSAQNIDDLYFRGEVPAWREFVEHGTYDDYWQRQNALLYMDDIQLPVLNVAGWFDTEDFYGPMSIYRAIEEKNPDNQSILAVGPWLHGGWRSMEGDFLGCIEFDSKTSLHFQQEIQYPFFQHYLKDEGVWSETEAVVFQTGLNEWRSFGQWPPEGVEATPIYLRAGEALSFDAPAVGVGGSGDPGYDRYVSDPNKPVPFSAELRTTLGHLWKVEDQRFASTRPDVLVYESEILTEDLTIAGPILANLFVSTTGTDSDWVVKLIDVYPGDAENSRFCEVPMGSFQMHLAGEVMRGKFRNSFEAPEPMVPGEVTPIRIDLRDRFHTFKAGHRVMVHVQSSWFPAYDRNPQQFMDIYQATPADYRVATQTVYRSAQYPSHLVVGVLR
ncbi:CocE/NonD family hydrolase [Gemmatimonadota bacterium]